MSVALVLSAGVRPAAGQSGGTPRGSAGAFDFYVLALTWSPAFCAWKGAAAPADQCATGLRHGLLVHGLWPQYQRGWPQYCQPDTDVPDATETAMADLMPSRTLVEHEWDKHGTCSGLDIAAYFAATRQARAQVRVPEQLRAPAAELRAAPDEIERWFVAANPGLSRGGLAVACRDGRLTEVRICLDRDLRFARCSAEVDRGQACRAPSIRVLPPG